MWLICLVLLFVRSGAALDRAVVISVYQGACQEGNFAGNLSTARDVIKEARERGSHFVAFPECFLSGYENAEALRQGARSLDDTELRAFIQESAAHDMVVLAGVARRAAARLFNSVLVIHGGRLLGSYDKVMLTSTDRDGLGFTAGSGVPVFEAHGAKFAVSICADTSYPHAAAIARLQGAELLFTPHYNQIAEARADDHRRWVRNCHVGLACQLRMAIARANVIKTDRPGQIGYGDSFILNPQGEPLAEASLFKIELVTATLTPAMFRSPYIWGDLDETPPWLREQVADLLAGFRRPKSEGDLRNWFENMVVFHRFTPAEISLATGLAIHEVPGIIARLGLDGVRPAGRQPGDPLRVLPYPGGRHPRHGFLDGAVAPQRETKVSVFTPWNDGGYVVVDVPEAIFSNLGLTYLAHTHIPTIWDAQGVRLPRLEWTRSWNGHLACERALPNGIVFGAGAAAGADGVRFELWLRNGTTNTLTGLRVQNCVMLGAATGFSTQTLTNKLFRPPFAAARSSDGARWVITAWERCGRAWGNEWVPCLHSDPVFADCEAGATVRLRGWLWFFEGGDLEGELDRLARIAGLAEAQ